MDKGSRKKPARNALEFLLTEHWAILPEFLERMVRVAARDAPPAEAVASEFGIKLENTRTVSVREGIATIPVTGPLFRYANLFTALSGATSYEVLATDFTTALNDPSIEGILLAIDSPGGEVNGTSEVAELIYRGRGEKPILAHVSGLGASAAYWIASAADEVYAADTALLGSIGVIATFVDDSEWLEREGIQVIEIVSSQSPHKSLDPSDKGGRERIQRTVDELAAVSIKSVARNRGVSAAEVIENFGKGDILVGRSAVRAGLADQLATYEDVLARCHKRRRARAVSQRSIFDLVTSDGTSHSQDLAAQCESAGSPYLAILEQINGSPMSVNVESIRLRLPQPIRASKTQTTSAPEAVTQEDRTVEEKKTTTDAAPEPGADAQKEAGRVTALLNLAKEYDMGIEKAQAWIASDTTVEQATNEVLQELKAKQVEVPQPGAEQIRVEGVRDREVEAGFPTIGHQLGAIRAAAVSRGTRVDKRLLHIHEEFKAATGMSEAVDSEGGFLIQPQVSDRWIERMYEEGAILSRVTRTPIGANSNGLKINGIDETSRADGSRQGGIRGYWADEATAATATKPKFAPVELKLKSVRAAVYATDEELEDVVALGARIDRMVPKELTFKVEDALFRGTGSGQPLGMKNAPCKVEVSAESVQTADTIVAENIEKMYARMWAGSIGQAVFHINQDCWPQLFKLHHEIGVGGVPVFVPAGGLSAAPFGTLLGRPIIPIEYADTLGDAGDISFCDWSQMEFIDKGGVKSARSIHVKFLEEESVFRFSYRCDGQPSWKSALTPYKGTDTQSPFITLAARA
jgi:HK97 family phage major capsid protein